MTDKELVDTIKKAAEDQRGNIPLHMLLLLAAERIDALHSGLSSLATFLNPDKDGSYFLCEEAAYLVDEARELLNGGVE